MPTERLANDAQTTVATAYAAGSATMTVADATKLPTLSGGDQFRITCYTPLSPTNLEILIVTAVTGNVLSVSPAAEPIAGIQTPFAHPVGDVVANAITVDSLSALITQILAGGGSHFAWNETPAGVVNGSTATFALANAPTGLLLSLNGLTQRPGAGNDYTLTGSTVAMASAPLPGDSLMATYSF